VTAPETSSSIAARPNGPLSGESAILPGLTPWDCLEAGAAPGHPAFLWEAPGGEALAGIGAVFRLEASGPGRFADLKPRLARLLARAEHHGPEPSGFPGAIAIGGFAFAEQGARRGWPGYPDASFYVPSRIFWQSPGGATIETRWSSSEEERAFAEAGSGIGDAAVDAGGEPESGDAWDRAAWLDRVRRTLDRIRDGSFSKAVLARSVRIRLDRSADAIAIMASLRAAYPTCYRFLIADGRGNAFLGASPERLVRFAGGEVLTEAVAGTQRCEPGDDGSKFARALVESEKDRSEHGVVLRHLLETLTPLCESIAPKAPEVMRLPHLLHLRTPVRGLARAGAHVLDLVSRLHPTPAVGGWPRKEALAWIRGVEGACRGWYAGPVGWVNAAGEGDFAVGIRAIAIRERSALLFAGAGIVEGSDPDLEWNETELKMKGILDAVARD
jgi:menaquinone-specific isochorismate synthase